MSCVYLDATVSNLLLLCHTRWIILFVFFRCPVSAAEIKDKVIPIAHTIDNYYHRVGALFLSYLKAICLVLVRVILLLS